MLGSDADAAPNASEPFQLRHISAVVMDIQYDDEEPSEDEKQRDRLAKQLKKQRKLEKKARKEKEQKELEAVHDKEAVAPSQVAEEKEQPRSESRGIMALHARIVAEQEQRQKEREALSFSTQVPSPTKTSPVSASVESDWVDQIQDTCKNGSSLKFESSTSLVAGTFASNGVALVTEKLAGRAKGIEVLSSLLRSSLSNDTPTHAAESSGNAGTPTACATHCEQRAAVEEVGSAAAFRERRRDEPKKPAVRHGLQRRELSAISALRPPENRHPSLSSSAVCLVKEEPLVNEHAEVPPSANVGQLAKAEASRPRAQVPTLPTNLAVGDGFIRETASACRSPRRESRCPYTGLAHSMCCASSSPETEITVGSHHTSYGEFPPDHFLSTEDLVSGGRVSLKQVALDRWSGANGQPAGILQEVQVKVQPDEHDLDGLGRTEVCDQPISTFSLNWSCFTDGYRVRL